MFGKKKELTVSGILGDFSLKIEQLKDCVNKNEEKTQSNLQKIEMLNTKNSEITQDTTVAKNAIAHLSNITGATE